MSHIVSLNNIIDGICEKLYSEFGSGYEIYTEEVQQNLTEPCFSVVLLNPSMKQVLGKRYKRNNQFCIHYFPQSQNEARNECFAVQERLFDCLEYITVDGDLTMGTGMHGEMSDGVLCFFVNYDMYVYKQEVAEPNMETISSETNVKEG